MTTIRKQYSAALKAQIVQEVLKEERTITQIAAEHGLHPNLISKWKQTALTAMPASFDDRTQRQIDARTAKYEQQINDLSTEIGKLTTQLSWLKKKYDQGRAQGHAPDPRRAHER